MPGYKGDSLRCKPTIVLFSMYSIQIFYIAIKYFNVERINIWDGLEHLHGMKEQNLI